jgi:hypothetical protein
MAKQKLDLLQFPAGFVAQASALCRIPDYA